MLLSFASRSKREADLKTLITSVTDVFELLDPVESSDFSKQRVKVWTKALEFVEFLVDCQKGASHEVVLRCSICVVQWN